MEILGYIGFAVLIFLAATWTLQVRTELGAGVPAIFAALFFLISAIILGILDANKLHSFWIIPSGLVLAIFLAYIAVPMPTMFGLFRLVASVFANIVRVGISTEKIKAAQDASNRAAVEEWYSRNSRKKHDA